MTFSHRLPVAAALLLLPLLAGAAAPDTLAPAAAAAPAPVAAPVSAPAPAPAPESPSLAGLLKAADITVSGVVDASWDYADVDGGPGFHVFDTSQNAFSLHQLNLTVAHQPTRGVGLLVNTVLGDDAGVINGGATKDWDLTQAFVQYACGNGLVYMAGRFVTLAGAETINPAGNINASRSLLFYNQPFVHTGARASWAFTDSFTTTLGVVNSANNGLLSGRFLRKTDNNTSKTAELQFALTPFKPLQVFLTGYSGYEDAQAAGAGRQRNDTIDLVMNLAAGDALSFAINADYFAQEGAASGTVNGRGIAGYANYRLGRFRFAARGEYLDFDGGITTEPGAATNPLLNAAGTGTGRGWMREETLTLGYAPRNDVEFIYELRNDQVDNGVFVLPARDATGPLNDDQFTTTLKLIYKF